ncbi:uncharacterized protein [Dermacentor albipictus]|uniref:uncharacterized protein isoform X4 n=1 Tax=Dermacentor albipictus TaxID=60249 RepID=UPI0038FBF22F
MKCLDAFQRPSRASEKSLRYWREQTVPPARADLPASRHSGTWLRGTRERLRAAPALADDGIITWQRGQCTSTNIGSGAQYKSPPQLLSAGHDAATTMGRSPLCCYRFSPSFTSRWADTMSPDAVTLWPALCKDMVLCSLQLLKRSLSRYGPALQGKATRTRRSRYGPHNA